MWSRPFQAEIGRIPSAEATLHLWKGSVTAKASADLNSGLQCTLYIVQCTMYNVHVWVCTRKDFGDPPPLSESKGNMRKCAKKHAHEKLILSTGKLGPTMLCSWRPTHSEDDGDLKKP